MFPAPTLLRVASCSYIEQLWWTLRGISVAGLYGWDKFSPLLHIPLNRAHPIILLNNALSCRYASQNWRIVADVFAGSRSYVGKVFPVASWEANRELCFRRLQTTSVCTWTGCWTSNNPWRICGQGYMYWVSLMRASLVQLGEAVL